MIRPDQIPDEVVEAAAKAAHDLWRKQASVGDDIREYPQWDDVSRFYKDDLRDQAEAAIAAALNAWPGAEYVFRQPHRRAVDYSKPALILSLSQETREAGVSPEGRT